MARRSAYERDHLRRPGRIAAGLGAGAVMADQPRLAHAADDRAAAHAAAHPADRPPGPGLARRGGARGRRVQAGGRHGQAGDPAQPGGAGQRGRRVDRGALALAAAAQRTLPQHPRRRHALRRGDAGLRAAAGGRPRGEPGADPRRAEGDLVRRAQGRAPRAPERVREPVHRGRLQHRPALAAPRPGLPARAPALGAVPRDAAVQGALGPAPLRQPLPRRMPSPCSS